MPRFDILTRTVPTPCTAPTVHIVMQHSGGASGARTGVGRFIVCLLFIIGGSVIILV